MPQPDRMLISISRVSEIFERRYRWHCIHIDYEIGKADYPGEGKRLDDQ